MKHQRFRPSFESIARRGPEARTDAPLSNRARSFTSALLCSRANLSFTSPRGSIRFPGDRSGQDHSDETVKRTRHPHSDCTTLKVSALAAGAEVNESKGGSLTRIAGLDSHDVLIILGADF
jgi:hypothetical protein